MNRVILMGRLSKDVDMRMNGDQAISRFSMAVDRKGKDAGADFISCVAFGKIAEFIEKYFAKGNRIAIEGNIRTGSYQNKDGKTVYTTDVVVNSAEFCESKKDSSSGSAKPIENEGFMAVADGLEDEGLPFN